MRRGVPWRAPSMGSLPSTRLPDRAHREHPLHVSAGLTPWLAPSVGSFRSVHAGQGIPKTKQIKTHLGCHHIPGWRHLWWAACEQVHICQESHKTPRECFSRPSMGTARLQTPAGDTRNPNNPHGRAAHPGWGHPWAACRAGPCQPGRPRPDWAGPTGSAVPPSACRPGPPPASHRHGVNLQLYNRL